MTGEARNRDAAAAGAADLRPARKADARRIAELFRISSEGIADYIWQQLAHPGEDLLDVGQRRYERAGVPFSYQNCTVAELGGEVVAMAHAFIMPAATATTPDEAPDPVLQPYAELEVPGSFYLSGLAVLAEHRGRSIGTRLLRACCERARSLQAAEVSLICFERNEGALRLYLRQGFTPVDRRRIVPHPLFHQTGDALLMTLPLG